MGEKTRLQILDAARRSLLEAGYAGLSTRRISGRSPVCGSGTSTHHFGSKQNLLLAVLAAAENDRLLERQTRMYGDDVPLWKQWEQACGLPR